MLAPADPADEVKRLEVGSHLKYECTQRSLLYSSFLRKILKVKKKKYLLLDKNM